MNCQHCGTELSNKRAKNCQTCTSVLAEANKKGTYGFVMEAIVAAKADGLTEAEMHTAMRSAMKLGATQRAEWADEYRKQQAERKQEEAARVRFYQEHGYYPGQDLRGEDTRRDIEDGEAFKPARRSYHEEDIYN
jgi:hypothetical protein